MPRKPASTRPDKSNEANESTGSTDTTEPTAAASSQPADGGGPTPPTAPGSRFFSWLRSIDIRREQGWIGGVCAGIATRLGIDPLIVRGIAVVVAVLGGPAILLYAAAWLLLPDASDRIHLEDVFRGRFEPVIAAIGGLFVLAMLPVAQGFWFLGAGYWGAPDWGGSPRPRPVDGRPRGAARMAHRLDRPAIVVGRGGAPRWAAPRIPGCRVPPRPASAAFVASDSTVTPAPPTRRTCPRGGEQQAQVRAEQEAFRGQQAADRAAANRAAALKAQGGAHGPPRALPRPVRRDPVASPLLTRSDRARARRRRPRRRRDLHR
jgi:phage shock protein PspC (stress-responsive transcriptional regulator)